MICLAHGCEEPAPNGLCDYHMSVAFPADPDVLDYLKNYQAAKAVRYEAKKAERREMPTELVVQMLKDSHVTVEVNNDDSIEEAHPGDASAPGADGVGAEV